MAKKEEKEKVNSFVRLGIKHVYENVEKKTIAVVWEDGTSTTSKCSDEDKYDFSVGLALCIAKHNFENYHHFADAVKNRKKYYTAFKSKKSE